MRNANNIKKIVLLIGVFLFLSSCGTSALNLNENKENIPNEAEIAENTLTAFFENLSKNEFSKAINFFSPNDSDWENLKVYNEPNETDKVKMIENYCKATTTCLEAEILETAKISEDEYRMIVRFLNKDGGIYVLGPCCGATEEEMPPQNEFDFTVKKINGSFKVITPPVYVP